MHISCNLFSRFPVSGTEMWRGCVKQQKRGVGGGWYGEGEGWGVEEVLDTAWQIFLRLHLIGLCQMTNSLKSNTSQPFSTVDHNLNQIESTIRDVRGSRVVTKIPLHDKACR